MLYLAATRIEYRGPRTGYTTQPKPGGSEGETEQAETGVVIIWRPLPVAIRNAIQTMLSAAATAEAARIENAAEREQKAKKTAIDVLVERRVEINALVLRAILVGVQGVARAEGQTGDFEALPRETEAHGGLEVSMVPRAVVNELCEHGGLGADLFDLANGVMLGKISEAEKKS